MTSFTNRAVTIILFCCTIALVTLTITLVFNLTQIAYYHKVEAHISSINTELYEGVGDSQTSKAHFVTYNFIYEGKPYEVTQQVFTKIGKHIGDTVILRCNPNNPTQIANMSLIKDNFAFICFLLLFITVVFQQNFRGR